MLLDKSDSAQKVVHNSGRCQYKASMVDIIEPKHMVANTEYSTNRVKDSTVSKYKVLQSQFGRINKP